MKEENYDYIVKLMLVGNSNVGKTAFMHRFCQGTYNPKLPSTIGLDYQEKILISNGIKYMVQLWDTAGQQRFRTITPSYYRSAMGIILCYSVEDRDSFNSVAVWVKQIRKYSEEELPIIIVGNKCDLVRRQVIDKDGKAIADMYGADFMEASAKQDINIKEVILKILEKVKVKMNDGINSLKLSKSIGQTSSFCRC